MKGIKYISIVLIIMLIVTACNSNIDIEDENTEEEIEIESYDPIDGGTMTISTTRYESFNPLFNKNKDLFQVHHLIYEGLVTFKEDMSIKPLLAESWTFNGTESIDLKLRQGVRWHDGQPLTADDVIYTFNLIKGNIKGINKASIYRQSLSKMGTITKLDDTSVRIHLLGDVANSLEALTFPILPQHIFENKEAQLLEEDDSSIIGTGMYKLKQYEKTRKIYLTRNDDYWGDKPYIEEVGVIIVPDEEAQLSLFENGDIDFVYTDLVDWGKYTDDRLTRHEEFATPNYEFIGVNFRKDILNDINIRKAIAYSIDREKIASNIYLGHATVVDYPIMPDSWLYDYSKIQLGYNPSLAETFLDKAGYTLKENSVRTNEKGESLNLKLITNTGNMLRDQTALLIQEDLSKVGIGLEIELLEWEDLEREIITNKYDLFLGGWELSYIPNITDIFHSSAIGSSNFIAYNSEKLDGFLDAYLSSNNLELKERRFSVIEEYIAEELPYISLFFKNGVIIVNKNIKGDLKPQSYNVFSNISSWYINTK